MQEVGISPPGPGRRGGDRPGGGWELHGEVLQCYMLQHDVGFAQLRFHRQSANLLLHQDDVG